MELSNKNTQSEDQIDIIALLSKLWDGKKLIIRTVCIFGIIGVFVALSTPNQYTASAMFTPNSSGSSPTGSSSLKGLASLAGINIGGMSEGGKELSPMLYGKILESPTFKKQLLDAPLKNIPGVPTLRAYFMESTGTVLGTVKEYTLGLLFKIIGLFKGTSTEQNLESLEGITSVSEEDFEYFKAIDEILTLSINDKDGFLEIIAKSKNPQVAAQVAKKKGAKIISLVGKNGGYLKKISDCCIHIKSQNTAVIQESHMSILHAICIDLDRKLKIF